MSKVNIPPTTVTPVESAAASRILENAEGRLALVRTNLIGGTAGSEPEKQVVISMSVAGKVLNFNRKSTDLIAQVLSRMKISCGKAMKEASTCPAGPDASPVKKMHKGERPVLIQPDVAFVNDESGIIEEGTLEEVLSKASAIRIADEEYHIVKDPPVVTSLEIETEIWAGFPVVASWTSTGAPESEFRFEWWIVSPETNEAVKIENSASQVFIPKPEHVGNFLEVRCFHPEFPEYHISALSTDKIAKYSEKEARLESALPATSQNTLRVSTFNILAQPYVRTPLAQDSYYTHLHNRWHLTEWSRRCPLIMREMLDSNADIYCLQEVAGGAHETQLKRFLSERNLDWHFFGKESLANNGNPIGVSISLRKDKFKVISEFKLSLGKEGLVESSSCLTEGEKMAIETQFGEGFFAKESPVLKGIHTVAGVVHARTIPDGRDVLVANTHLFFHPFGGHIRILQGVCLMRKLEILRMEIARPDAKVPAIIVCGDFNSRPDSGSFEVMSTGRIMAHNQDWQYGRTFRSSSKETPVADEDEAGGQEIVPCEENVNEKSLQGVDLTHPLSLGHIPSKIPELTHATASFRSTLDYIFYSTESFEAQEGPGTGSSIPELTNAEVDRMGGLPCDYFGSDHVLVCGDLRFVGSE